MRVELECTSLDALAAALADRILGHVDSARETCEDAGELGDAARWASFRRVLGGSGGELRSALEGALDYLIAEQAILAPCPRCGGQRDRDPGGEVYCTECCDRGRRFEEFDGV